MSELQEHVTGEWWGAGRAVPIIHALDALLSEMEHQLASFACDPRPCDGLSLPLSTGLLALDRVLGGGVNPGSLTLVEADLEAQAMALTLTVARRVPHNCLLDVADFFEALSWLLASDAGVPAVSLRGAALTESEWQAVASSVGHLAGRDLSVSSTGSVHALARVAAATDPTVVLVHDTDRFGPPIQFVPKLAMLAASTGLAMIATAVPAGDLPRWALEGVTRVSMQSFNLGGRATLLRADATEMLVTQRVTVECLSGVVL